MQICLKYGLCLVGYPRDEICDPSNLSTNELFALRESLQKGTCTFEHLSDADKEALRAAVNEQERRGENPWRKQKCQSDFGKSKKTRKISDPTVPLGSTSIHTYSAQHDLDSDNEHSADDDGIGGEDWPLPGASSACESADCDSDSGEDELGAADDDPMHHLSRCIRHLENIKGITRDS